MVSFKIYNIYLYKNKLYMNNEARTKRNLRQIEL